MLANTRASHTSSTSSPHGAVAAASGSSPCVSALAFTPKDPVDTLPDDLRLRWSRALPPLCPASSPSVWSALNNTCAQHSLHQCPASHTDRGVWKTWKIDLTCPPPMRTNGSTARLAAALPCVSSGACPRRCVRREFMRQKCYPPQRASATTVVSRRKRTYPSSLAHAHTVCVSADEPNRKRQRKWPRTKPHTPYSQPKSTSGIGIERPDT
eukprot:987852-Rhodomonas_salina.2